MASLKVHSRRAPSPKSDGSEGSSDVEEDSLPSDAEEAEIEATADDANDEAEDASLEAASSEDPSAGWADAMAKILNKKTPASKPIILLKNKKLMQEKEKDQKEKLEKRKQFDKKRQWEMMCRVKPDVAKDREAERNLQKIATRGVVQLFNAVRKHQSNINEKVKEAGSSDRKRAKLISSVSKKDFIDVLRGKKESKTAQTDRNRTPKSKQVTVKSESGPEWSILRDDFMMGATMKDWDKESDDGVADAAQAAQAKDDSDTDSDR